MAAMVPLPSAIEEPARCGESGRMHAQVGQPSASREDLRTRRAQVSTGAAPRLERMAESDTSRREFLRRTGIGVAGLAVGGAVGA
ncbi:twin-arginine translocation signal domain-containing protein, partial [Microbacterium sp.]|uniref:twin-arginine translocation signal domain-containing protein n=1 Tax=Microbacterium sp. TaxID=51671 RepID=UPI003C725384